MKYQIVVTDFDDTLLKSDLTISTYTKDVINRYEQKGGTFIISTGRMYQSIVNSVQRVGLNKGIVITYQGALITDMTDGRVLFSQTMDYKTAANVTKKLENENDCSLQIYINDIIYVKEKTEAAKAYEKNCEIVMTETGINLSDYILQTKVPVAKILAILNPQRANELCSIYTEEFGGIADFCLSKPYFFECIPKGASKGRAVEFICKLKGLSNNDVITFGDGNNDISMLMYADLSFAVENAQQEAKIAAKQICPSNDDDGVAKTIEKYCL